MVIEYGKDVTLTFNVVDGANGASILLTNVKEFLIAELADGDSFTFPAPLLAKWEENSYDSGKFYMSVIEGTEVRSKQVFKLPMKLPAAADGNCVRFPAATYSCVSREPAEGDCRD